MLLGAHAEGVRNVLAITGDPPEVGDYPGSRGVYELDAIGLTRLIARLNRGEDFNGRPIDAPTVVLRRRRRQPDRRRPRARGRALPPEARGRRAVRDDADRLRPRRARPRSLERLGGWPIPVLVGVFPVTSYRLALRLHNEVPGIVVPAAPPGALRDAGRGRGRGRHGARARAARGRRERPRRRLRRRAVPPAARRARAARARELPERRSRAGSRFALDVEQARSARRSRSAAGAPASAAPPCAPSGWSVQLHRDGAADPDEREPEDRAEHGARRASRARAAAAAAAARRGRTSRRTARARRAAPRRRARRRCRRARCSSTRSAPERNCGASRAPTTAPATSPASERSVATSPRRKPAERREGHESDEDPVEGRHRRAVRLAATLPCARGRSSVG